MSSVQELKWVNSRRRNDPLDKLIRQAERESNLYLGCILSVSGLIVLLLVMIGKGITSFTPLSTRFPKILLDFGEGINYFTCMED